MFAGIAVVNLTMVVYHRLMSGSLGAAYAELAAVINLVNVLLVFAGGLSTTLAKHFAAAVAAQGPGALRGRLERLALPLAGGVAVLALALFLAGPWVQAYLKLPSPAIYQVAVVLVAGAVLIGVLRAALQGLHSFGWLSLSLAGEGLSRLAFAWGLVLKAGTGAAGALACSVGAVGAGALLLAPPLLGLPKPPKKAPPALSWGEGLVDTAALGLFSLLCYLDVFVVKHHQDTQMAADYTRIALVGKSFLYVGSALVFVLVPAVARARARSLDPRPLLFKFLGAHLGLMLAGYAVVALFTGPVIALLCGPQTEFQAYAPAVRWFCLAVMPLALYQLVLLHLLALGERKALWLLGGVALAYFAALEAFHGSTLEVAAVLGGASSLALLSGLALAARRPARRDGLGPEEGIAVALQEIGD